MLKRSNLLKHLTCDLGVETNCAVLELVEWRIESFVDVQKLFFHPLDLGFILNFTFLKSLNLLRHLGQISLSSLNVLFGLHQKDFLLSVMLFDGFSQRVFSVLEHFNHQIKFLVKLCEGVLLLLLKLFFDFLNIIFKYFCFSQGGLNFLDENLFFLENWIHLILWLDDVVTNSMTFVLTNYTF